jgi:hypothetical protein
MVKQNLLRDVLGGSILAFTLLTSVAHAEWSSPEECYAAHVRLATGRYPRPGDDISLLMKHCEYEYKSKACTFFCEPVRLQWEFAVGEPPSRQRDIYLRAYFKRAQAQRTSCDIFTRIAKGCPTEPWDIP